MSDKPYISIEERLQKLEAGSIIETITNENGIARKFAGGTMICTKKVTIESKCTTSWGVMYETGYLNLGNFAEKFATIEQTQLTLGDANGGLLSAHRNVTNTSARSS